MLKQGDKVKNWALTNKFKVQKKNKQQLLYLYIQAPILENIKRIYDQYKGRMAFKWTKIKPFDNFSDILQDLKER